MSKPIVVVTSGYFDPLHEGHIESFEKAKALGDKLVVIVNSDKQAILKKGKPFMNEKTRMAIIKALRVVDEAILSIDDDRTVRKTLEMIKPDIFAKGGDYYTEDFPEAEICKRLGIKIVIGLGDKINSSSWILKNAEKNKEETQNNK